jgi:hypothetical protein
MALRCCDRGMSTVHFCCDVSAMKQGALFYPPVYYTDASAIEVPLHTPEACLISKRKQQAASPLASKRLTSN